MREEERKMEVSAKSSITFSINGILSSPPREREFRRQSPSSTIKCNYTEYPSSIYNNPYYEHSIPSPPIIANTYQLPFIQSSGSIKDDLDIRQSKIDYHDRFMSCYEKQKRYNYPPLQTHLEPDRSCDLRVINSSPSARRSSPETYKSVQQTSEKNTSPAGRFRPPPFFETVLMLRKRLYNLGGQLYPTDEPPMDRNVHKLWRAVEKHKVNYSLQHYFYVASLSNRCFDLVDRINQKVTLGLLEGSREKEVNQSYFNFLYGKTEEERYQLLLSLEKGEVSPKDFIKQKQSSNAKNDETSCHSCQVTVVKLKKEKKKLELELVELKRKYEQILSHEKSSSVLSSENLNKKRR